jgi:hypothetical protein
MFNASLNIKAEHRGLWTNDGNAVPYNSHSVTNSAPVVASSTARSTWTLPYVYLV